MGSSFSKHGLSRRYGVRAMVFVGGVCAVSTNARCDLIRTTPSDEKKPVAMRGPAWEKRGLVQHWFDADGNSFTTLVRGDGKILCPPKKHKSNDSHPTCNTHRAVVIDGFLVGVSSDGYRYGPPCSCTACPIHSKPITQQ
jgi:hypothetical protein